MSGAAPTPATSPERSKRQPRRLSLRTALTLSIGGMLATVLASSLAVEPRLFASTHERAHERKRYHRLILNAQAHLGALVDQEVGLRAYLATGNRIFLEPYRSGLTDENRVSAAIEADLTAADRGEVAMAWLKAQRTSAAWQAAIAEPQRRAREVGPFVDLDVELLEGKRLFDDLRTAHTQLQRAFEERSASVIAAIDAQIERLHAISLAIAALTTALGLSCMAFILKQTAAPLAQLARTALEHGSFDPPSQNTRIAEIQTLAAALYELDQRVKAREQVIGASREGALALAQFGELVQQIAEEQELRRVLVRSLEEKVHPIKTQMMLRNASRNRLEIVWPEVAADEQYKYPILGDPIKCRAVRTLRQVTADAGSARCCECPLGVPKQGSYSCVPMLAAGDLVGVVNLQLSDTGGLDAEQQQTTQGYVGFASSALSSIRLLAATRERALRDPLTGAYNRSFLSEHLRKQLSHAQRREAPLSVLVLDLDHFKRLNDNYGHQVGDRALVAFAGCVLSKLRGSDTVVRYGGEEFVVVLPDAGMQEAEEVAERIRSSVAGLVLDTGREQLSGLIHTSIGAATFPGHGLDEAALIAAADRALYRAKQSGRNRVVTAAALEPTAHAS